MQQSGGCEDIVGKCWWEDLLKIWEGEEARSELWEVCVFEEKE